MPNSPLVSVICVCFNQAKYVEEAIQSVWDQEYPNVELIIVDDASSDGSKDVIKKKTDGSSVKFISLEQNVGNCKAFNLGWIESSGSFIIDLAADDVLLPGRISLGVESLAHSKIGVHFTDCMLLNEQGTELGNFYSIDYSGLTKESVPQGDVYKDLIQTHFISAPTMMIRKEVLEDLNGYDERLSYEDFDFWIRSSRNWEYGFSERVLVKKRVLADSHGRSQFQKKNRHQKSTLEVCKKIKELNKTPEENRALRKRCLYEIKQSLKLRNYSLIPSFFRLMF